MASDKYFPRDEITGDIETQFALWQAGKLPNICTPFECNELYKAWNNSFEFEIRYNWQGYQYRFQMAYVGLQFDRELRYLIPELSLIGEIRSRINGYARASHVVPDASVKVEIYSEILNGTSPGFLRLLSSRARNQEESKDRYWRVRQRIREARRYGEILRQLGYGGLVFMGSWFKRSWITRTTIEEWVSIMNILQDGRAWFHGEIVRVFGGTAPRLLETLIGIT